MPDNIDYAHTSNVARLHAAVAREKSEPVAKPTPISMGVIAGLAGIAIVAGGYFGANTGNVWAAANVKGYNYEPVPPGDAPPPPEPDAAELRQPDNWIAAGKAEYGNSCVSCHLATGTGTPGSFPHLNGSEFVIHGEKRLIAILLHGIGGSLTVDGKPFNGAMPAQGALKSNIQIAQLASYVRRSFGNSASIIYDDQAAAVRKEIARTAPFTETELRAIPQDDHAPPSKWPDEIKKAAGGAPAAAPAAGVAAPGNPPAPAK